LEDRDRPILMLLAIPASLLEPLKLGAVAIAGDEHWVAGTIAIVCACAVSLLVVERLFWIVKPKLLRCRGSLADGVDSSLFADARSLGFARYPQRVQQIRGTT
jgi:hypothetical protein